MCKPHGRPWPRADPEAVRNLSSNACPMASSWSSSLEVPGLHVEHGGRDAPIAIQPARKQVAPASCPPL
jgi:hypothetical protein